MSIKKTKQSLVSNIRSKMKGEALRVPPPKVSCYKAESAVISYPLCSIQEERKGKGK